MAWFSSHLYWHHIPESSRGTWRRNNRTLFVLSISAALIIPFMFLSGLPPSMVAVFRSCALLFAIATVSLLIGRTYGTRFGDGRFCRKCGYQLPPDHPPARCSECGNDWLSPRGYWHGERRVDKEATALGAVALLVVIILTTTARSPNPWLPHWILVEQLRDRHFFRVQHYHVITPTMTPAESEHLARVLIEIKKAGRPVGYNFETWLSNEVRREGISRDIVDAYRALQPPTESEVDLPATDSVDPADECVVIDPAGNQ